MVVSILHLKPRIKTMLVRVKYNCMECGVDQHERTSLGYGKGVVCTNCNWKYDREGLKTTKSIWHPVGLFIPVDETGFESVL
jgi:DNA-directed RNA polymerase subunit RPC12/RpoP